MARPMSSNIAVGDRFFEVGQFGSRWVVRQIFTPRERLIPHAVIEHEADDRLVEEVPLFLLLAPARFRRDRSGVSRTLPV